MIRNKKCVFWLAVALTLCGAGLKSIAQETTAPIVIGTAPQTRKIIKTHFEVLRMMYQAIQVRSLTDMREIHTFTYAPEIRDQMQRVFNAGGYQYGDKVVVWYQAGASVALKIKGKPSKPN